MVVDVADSVAVRSDAAGEGPVEAVAHRRGEVDDARLRPAAGHLRREHVERIVHDDDRAVFDAQRVVPDLGYHARRRAVQDGDHAAGEVAQRRILDGRDVRSGPAREQREENRAAHRGESGLLPLCEFKGGFNAGFQTEAIYLLLGRAGGP